MSNNEELKTELNNMEKPHKGSIERWTEIPCDAGLGYYIAGRFVNHPEFGYSIGQTSYVVKHDRNTNEIETRNSRYTLV